MSTTEVAAGNYQMYLNSAGELTVENMLIVPAIYLNNVDLQTTLNNNYNGIVNINNTLPSFLQLSTFTSASLLNTAAFNNTLNSNLSLYTPLTTYNNTITTRLNGHDTSLTNISNTLPSFLQIATFTSTSLLNTTAFNNTLTSNLNLYTPLTTYNNTITTRLNGHDTSLTNISNTLPSFLQISTFTSSSLLNTNAFNNTLTSNLSSYTPLTTYNNTITTRLNGHDTSLTNISNTLPSFLQISTFTSASLLNTTAFNSTLNSNLSLYTPLTTYNNTITTRLNNITTTLPSFLQITAFQTTSTSQLSTKQNKNTYVIPNVASSWVLLGTLTTAQTGNVSVIDIYSNANVMGYAWDEMRYTCQFSTSNGTSSSQNGNDGTAFYGEATITISNTASANVNLAIQQVSATSYNFFFNNSSTPGNGIFRFTTNDTFTYSGATSSPSGCYILPKVLYRMNLDYNNYSNLWIDSLNANFFSSQYGTYAMYDGSSNNLANFNIGGSTINSNLNVSGNIAGNSITGTSLFITGSGTIGTNINSIGTLFVSSNTTLRSSLNVNLGITGTTLSVLGNITASGPTHIMNASSGGGDVSLTLRNFASGTTSLYLNTNNTLSSRLYSDGVGNIFVNAITTTSTVKFNFSSTLGFTITNTGGTPASDIRFKSDIQNITNPMEKINSIQGKTFRMYDNNYRSLGFIGQDLLPIIPEATYVDTSTEENYIYVHYDKLTALHNEGINFLYNEINSLKIE